MTARKLPILNVYAKGDYTVQMQMGSEQQPVNLLLDSGSSTLVVNQSAYDVDHDKALTPTSYAQEVNYGIGGWDGPVVHTEVSIGQGDLPPLTLAQCPVALVPSATQQQTFGDADGILGLAYHHLNKSYNLEPYLTEHNVNPPVTFPWPFSSDDSVQYNGEQFSSEDLDDFKHFLWAQPEQDVTPYMKEMSSHRLAADKFAFYSRRSSIHCAKAGLSADELAQDPLNRGWLIMGGGEEYTELYQGEFKTIPVEHDVYYNVTLKAIQIGDKPKIAAPPLQQEYMDSYFTNAIVDTGASVMVLTNTLFQAMSSALADIDAGFVAQVGAFADISAQDVGIDMNELNLDGWPELKFYFGEAVSENETEEEVGEVCIVCKPTSYWQINTPSPGKACFKILSQLPQWPDQSILGLPLMTNHYLVFDRSEGPCGVIRIAKAK